MPTRPLLINGSGNQVTVTGTPATDKIIKCTSATAASWQDDASGGGGGSGDLGPLHPVGMAISRASATTLTVGAGHVVGNATTAVLATLSSAITKSIASTFAQGTGNGGLATGTVASDTWYYVFLITKDADGTVDVMFDSSNSGANVPSGWSVHRRIAFFATDGSAEIPNWTWYNTLSGYVVLYGDSLLKTILDTVSPATTQTEIIAGPAVAGVQAIVDAAVNLTSLQTRALSVYHNLDATNRANAIQMRAESGNANNVLILPVWCNAGGEIAYSVNNASNWGRCRLRISGHIDYLSDYSPTNWGA